MKIRALTVLALISGTPVCLADDLVLNPDAGLLSVNGGGFASSGVYRGVLIESGLIVGSVREFVVQGDFVAEAGDRVVATTGSMHAIRILVGNNATINAGAEISVSASGGEPRAGGGLPGSGGSGASQNSGVGSGGNGGSGGAGGSGGTGGSVTSSLGGNGGTGQDGANGRSGNNGGVGRAGSRGSNGLLGNAGQAGVNGAVVATGGTGGGGGAGGSQVSGGIGSTAAGQGGDGGVGGGRPFNSSSSQSDGGQGGRFGSGGRNGTDGNDGRDGNSGLTGGAGTGGVNDGGMIASLVGGGGGAGGGGGGAGGAGSGGSGAGGGSGGGGGGGGGGGESGESSDRVSAGSGGRGGTGGTGGRGGSGGQGGIGGSGGTGGRGGAGGGAIEIRANGILTFDGQVLSTGSVGSSGSSGGSGSNGQLGSSRTGGSDGGDGNNGGSSSNRPGGGSIVVTPGANGGSGGNGSSIASGFTGSSGSTSSDVPIQFSAPGGGGGGAGGAGAGGFRSQGGDGADGGRGGRGGDGAGGTVALSGSAVRGNGTANTSGGSNNGQGGRVIVSGLADQLVLNEIGVETRIDLPSILLANPFTDGDTPALPGLAGGAEAFGTPSDDALDVLQEITDGLMIGPDIGGVFVAIVDDPSRVVDTATDVPGFDLLVVMNPATDARTIDHLGVDGVISPLLQGGFATQLAFGGNGPTLLGSLGGSNVYVTLIPEVGTETVRVGFPIGSGMCDVMIPVEDFLPFDGAGIVRIGEACSFECPADFDTNFVLNFNDIVEFLDAYTAMDPSADLAAPIGSFNFFDISTFIGSFNDGCP